MITVCGQRSRGAAERAGLIDGLQDEDQLALQRVGAALEPILGESLCETLPSRLLALREKIISEIVSQQALGMVGAAGEATGLFGGALGQLAPVGQASPSFSRTPLETSSIGARPSVRW